jgi:hypothetical protein
MNKILMQSISIKPFAFLLTLVGLLLACDSNHLKEENLYAETYLFKAGIDADDIDSLLTSQTTNMVSESTLKKRMNWNAMQLIDTISLACQIDTLFVWSAKVKKQTIIVYQTTDSTNLAIYFSGINLHSESLLVSSTRKYRKALKLLIENDGFIVKKLEEKFPSSEGLKSE